MWGMKGTRLFDIPVYRVSPEQWWKEQEREYQRYLTWFPHFELSESDKSDVRQWVHEQKGGYQFNQIMGWVQVVRAGYGHIKLYYVRVVASRVT